MTDLFMIYNVNKVARYLLNLLAGGVSNSEKLFGMGGPSVK